MVRSDGVKPAANGRVRDGTCQVHGLVGKAESLVMVAEVCEDATGLSEEVVAGGDVASPLGIGGGLLVARDGEFRLAEVVGQEADETAGVGRQSEEGLAFDLAAGAGDPSPNVLMVFARGFENHLGAAQVVDSAVHGPQVSVGGEQVLAGSVQGVFVGEQTPSRAGTAPSRPR
ncbi:hypothetical protein ACFV19_32470 [Streptomyces griseoluteus]|uniref:hypothetical protein n=1 Tax=Streptomyces griseoluteus TaxID=29306 RepID=UPI0036BDC8F3